VEFDESVRMLRRIPMFAKLDISKLKLLAFAGEYQTFDDGEVLFYEGEAADCAYIIDEGEAVVSGGQGEDAMTVSTLGKHSLFGEMAIFRGSTRTATVKAGGSLKVIRIDGSMFLKMVTENPDAALGVMQVLSDKIARAMNDYGDLDKKYRALKDGA